MGELILAIDQGTTGTTVLVFDPAGKIIGRGYREIRQYYPQSGWVEHDPEEIFASALALCRQALRAARRRPADVATIGIANQRETLVVWERRSGRPLGRAIVWQCRRSADICRRLAPHEAEINRRTGLLLDPYFSATKLKWMLDRDRALRRRGVHGELCFGTIDSWLIFRLSGGRTHVTEYTNASRTMLMNLRKRSWDERMLEIFGVPSEMLPELRGSRGPLAETEAGVLGPRPIPIGGALGDQQAAMFGQGAVSAERAKVTYGTGAFVLIHTGQSAVRSRNRMLTTAAVGAEGEPAMALEGAIFIAGAAVQWLRDGLGIIRRASDTAAMAAAGGASDSRVHFIPAFVGLGAPYWDSGARGAILGLSRGTSASDIVRAALEGVAHQVADVLGAMERDVGRRIRELRADGGAAANDYLMQFQADVLGIPVRRAAMLEGTALGAAILAGLACGVIRSPDVLRGAQGTSELFRPRIAPRRREVLRRDWRDAVKRVLSH